MPDGVQTVWLFRAGFHTDDFENVTPAALEQMNLELFGTDK